MRTGRAVAFIFPLSILAVSSSPLAQQALPVEVVVRAIEPPAIPLPPESASVAVRKFSFIAYGDTRGPADGVIIQSQHSAVMDTILRAIATERAAGFPLRFVIQSGDAVTNGRSATQWNSSFIPIIERLTRGAGLPAGDPDREAGLNNAKAAMSNLWPPEGSVRRLDGYPTFAFGFGQMLFITFDSNIPEDPVQLAWVSGQLEKLDQRRFPFVVAFFHHPPITSGPHGGAAVERESATVRRLYLPLFRKYHVRMTITGHDHLYDHFVEHYDDTHGTHRMDHIVSGGGGAPIYAYRGEPDLA